MSIELILYLATLALHAAFVSYVVVGSAYVLARRDALAEQVRDRLPFMLGAAITAGVAPLLFVQLLHQRRFYTANLLLGPRWMAVVPALIVGFYALYAAKKLARRWPLAIALPCFLFVAYSWSELHELMQADPGWAAFYAAGDRVFVAATIAPRLAVLLPAMASGFATIAAWSAAAEDRRRLAVLAVLGRVVSAGGAVWLHAVGFAVSGSALAWLGALAAAVVVEIAAWAWVRARPRGPGLTLATGAGSGALLAAVVVREAPRLAVLEPERPLGEGWLAFALALVLGGVAIGWVVKTVYSSDRLTS
jgi:hypothetical protein